MELAGEVVTAPLFMAAALGVAFVFAWVPGTYVIYKTLRADAGQAGQAEEPAAEPRVEQAA